MSLPAPTIRKTVPEHQSPLHQTDQQLFSPGCESPELTSPRPSLEPHTNHLPPPPQPYHITGKNCHFVQFKVYYTQVSGPVQTTCFDTLSSIRTRHFHTLLCVHKSHKRLSNICMFTCSCTTNHRTLFPSQLLESFSFLHRYSICEAFVQLYSLYSLVYV